MWEILKSWSFVFTEGNHEDFVLQVDSYTLEVQVTDSGEPQLSTTVPVHLDILDANDCPPRFKQDNLTASVQVCMH